MNALQDAREVVARWDRQFAGKRERVNLGSGRRSGRLAAVVAGLKGSGTVAVRRTAYGR